MCLKYSDWHLTGTDHIVAGDSSGKFPQRFSGSVLFSTQARMFSETFTRGVHSVA